MATADEKKLLVEIIREMIENNENVLNSTMAEEASRRLGRPVTKEEISRVRSENDLGTHHLAARRAGQHLVALLRRLHESGYTLEEVIAYLDKEQSDELG